MKRHGHFLLGISVGLLLPACPAEVFAQRNNCTELEQKQAALLSNDLAYRDAIELSEALQRKGISVKCVLPSTMEGTFEGQKEAAIYRSDQGSFEVLFLLQPKSFDRLKITEWRDGQRYGYRFKGSPSSGAGNGIDSAFQLYFIKNRNILIIVQNDTELASMLQEFVHSER